MHAGVGQFGRDVLEVVDKEVAEERGFLGEVGDDAVVHHADDRIASLAGGFRLPLGPLQEVGGDVAPDFAELFAVGCVVRAVAVRVDDDDGEALLRTGHIRGGARFSAFRRRVGRRHGLVIPGEVLVDRQEVLLGGPFRLDRLAAFGVEVLGGGVVDVVVAGRDVDLEARQVLFQLFQLGGKGLVCRVLTVFGDVAVQEQHVRFRKAYLLKLGIQDSFRLVEHLLVEVDGVLVVRGPFDHGLGDGVHVGHDHDAQVVLPRGLIFGKTHGQGQDQGQDHGQKHCQQFLHVFHSEFPFLSILCLYPSIID